MRPVRGPVPPLLLAMALLLISSLTGCSGSSVTSGGRGYLSGDGRVEVLDPVDRKPPAVEVAGTTVDGDPVSLSALRGKVVVMPVWGSWCAPCRAEAPMLAQAARDLRGDGVVFLGLNPRDDNVAKVRRFLLETDPPYQSIYDPGGEVLLAFHGTLPPMSTPSFAFVDADGRVAARILGEVDRSTLYGVVEDLLGAKVDQRA